MEECVQNHHKHSRVRNENDDERSAKILEVDTWKPHFSTRHNRENIQTANQDFASSHVSFNRMVPDTPSKHPTFSGEVLCLKEHVGKGEALRYFENIPNLNPIPSRPGSSISRRDPFSPTKSEVSWGGYSGYLGHPSYMANTESSRAKARSQSAPRQRVEFENNSFEKSNGGLNSERGYPPQVEFWTRAYSERQRRTDLR